MQINIHSCSCYCVYSFTVTTSVMKNIRVCTVRTSFIGTTNRMKKYIYVCITHMYECGITMSGWQHSKYFIVYLLKWQHNCCLPLQVWRTMSARLTFILAQAIVCTHLLAPWPDSLDSNLNENIQVCSSNIIYWHHKQNEKKYIYASLICTNVALQWVDDNTVNIL